jgi:diguanylate cyclase (GGDEF)-like protein/PAS domain S-box-containing protein
MTERPASNGDAPVDSAAEVTRLRKVVSALMDRAERSASAVDSEFGLFQSTIMLEEQVRRRTAELEDALRENERVNRALRESEARFRGLVSQSMVGIVIIEDGRFSYSNAKFDEMFGYTAAEMRELGPLDVALDGDRAFIADNLRRRISGELDRVQYTFHGRRKDGSLIEVELHGGGMDTGNERLLISLAMDITERARAERELKRLQERLREQSTRDALTGLHNRRHLEETLERTLTLAEHDGQPVSIIMADLDYFKLINDRLGHPAGDAVLRKFGALLTRCARADDVCCRYGGDEFLLVLPGLSACLAADRAERLRSATTAELITYRGSDIALSASFGVATFPGHGATADELIAAADKALYAAKSAGRNRVRVGAAPRIQASAQTLTEAAAHR